MNIAVYVIGVRDEANKAAVLRKKDLSKVIGVAVRRLVSESP